MKPSGWLVVWLAAGSWLASYWLAGCAAACKLAPCGTAGWLLAGRLHTENYKRIITTRCESVGPDRANRYQMGSGDNTNYKKRCENVENTVYTLWTAHHPFEALSSG